MIPMHKYSIVCFIFVFSLLHLQSEIECDQPTVIMTRWKIAICFPTASSQFCTLAILAILNL
uniref:Uncharacterized protein n=1 Tax=Anguilla anguilla TaxID=7936 RepID=A0A0E9XLW2_ANGAN